VEFCGSFWSEWKGDVLSFIDKGVGQYKSHETQAEHTEVVEADQDKPSALHLYYLIITYASKV